MNLNYVYGLVKMYLKDKQCNNTSPRMHLMYWVRMYYSSQFPENSWAKTGKILWKILYSNFISQLDKRPIRYVQVVWVYDHFNGSVQDCSNSIANALELLQSCTKPLIYKVILVITLPPEKLPLPPEKLKFVSWFHNFLHLSLFYGHDIGVCKISITNDVYKKKVKVEKNYNQHYTLLSWKS